MLVLVYGSTRHTKTTIFVSFKFTTEISILPPVIALLQRSWVLVSFLFRLQKAALLELHVPYENHFINLSFIFLHFRVLLDFLTHLAKFQSIMNIRSHFVLTFNSENLRPPLINLVPSLGCK